MSDPRIVLVTGASSGIGRASAALLAHHRCRVFGIARTAPPAHDGSFAFLPGDIRDDGSVRECVSRVLREAGRIDVLVNCAGVIVAGPAEEMLPDEIMDQIQTNLLGTMRMCQAVLPAMRKQGGGRIITVGSLAGLMGLPFQSAYSASKYGIEGYSESLQMEVQRFGIRVVVVDPGDIATEITSHRKVTRGSGSGSPYKQNFDDAMRSQAESERHGWKVERVARLIERIVRSRSATVPVYPRTICGTHQPGCAPLDTGPALPEDCRRVQRRAGEHPAPAVTAGRTAALFDYSPRNCDLRCHHEHTRNPSYHVPCKRSAAEPRVLRRFSQASAGQADGQFRRTRRLSSLLRRRYRPSRHHPDVFPIPRSGAGKKGAGETSAVAFSVPGGAFDFWIQRLSRAWHAVHRAGETDG